MSALSDWAALAREHPRIQQFGQSDDESTYNGSTGCTHAMFQLLVLGKTGHLYSQDEISKVASYPWPAQNPSRRGMRTGGNDNESGRVIDHFGLPYEIRYVDSAMTDAIWLWLRRVNARGPVMVGVRYGYYPEQRGLVTGVFRNGRAKLHGATQTRGFDGAHMTTRLGQQLMNDDGRWYDVWKEPNHGSSARPERPPYDRFLSYRGKVAAGSMRHLYVNGRPRSLLFIYPTQNFHPR